MSRRRSFRHTLSIVLLGLLAGGALAADGGRSIVTSPDSDYFGFDLRTEQNVSLAQCEQSCIDDDSCRAFTYNPKVRWCFMKSDFTEANPFPGAIAGRVVEVSDEPDLGAPARLAFLSEDMLRQARDLKAGLSVPDELKSAGLSGLIGLAHMHMSAGQTEQSLVAFKAALALSPDDGDVWVDMARAANLGSGNSSVSADGLSAAINGYELSRTTVKRADALSVLALALEKTDAFRPALYAYKASLEIARSSVVEAAFLDLQSRQGFRVVDHTIDSDATSPRACVQFSEALVKRGVDYSSFVQVDGKPAQAVEAKDNQICIEGLTHGERYQLTLRAGLPSSVDESLPRAVSLDLYVRDRSASVRFTGESFVLPSSARRGIPFVSINAEHADLRLYRIGERGLAPLLSESQFLTQLNGYSADQIESQSGELVWQGAIEIATELNKDVVTSFPVDEALPQRRPGVYVLTATVPGSSAEDWDNRATQWFVVSDIGLSTYAGTDGLSVFARSLSTAKPLANVDVQLLAKNNEVLGSVTTDDQGRAVLSPGLIRGGAALAPAVLTARMGSDDYVFLDMTRAGFDLSDRGVTGRPAPGAIDIFAWTERGIYRPGETVHAAALSRDSEAASINDLPLTFIFSRPDGVEYRRISSSGGALGGHVLDLPLLANAMRGNWTMAIHTDPEKEAIARQSFLVDDFVPDRTEFDLASAETSAELGVALPVTVDGRYLYGAPAAGLAIEGEVNIRLTRTRPDFERYQFGLADEEASDDTRVALEGLPVLDDQGHAAFDVSIDDVPATTQLLNAEVVVRMTEGGGRAVERRLSVPIKPEGPMIGIKPEFEGEVGENSLARFHLVGVGPDGSREPLDGLSWRLIKLERNYQWYREGNSWRYEPVITTRQEADGRLDLADTGAELSVPVSWGRYRLEVDTGSASGPATSVEFEAGWYVEAASTETPDGLEIALDKESYAVGDTARLKISPRFAGEVLVTVGTESLISTAVASIGAEGGEVDLPVTADWGGGTYVTATLYRPGEAAETRMPMRSIGISWAKVDPAERQLEITLSPPEQMTPRQTLAIPVSVEGAGVGEEAYVTVAAVDVGILNLTRYEPPAPESWYFGQRRLGLEVRDLYGRLIDGSLGATGRLRTGGDGAETVLQGNPPKEKLVAFFEGPVRLDANGKAEVQFDIPQFNGTVRIMAVAWSKTGVGHSSADVIVRDPVVVTANLPRFLAPGDETELRLELAATDAPSGSYQLDIDTNQLLSVDADGRSRTVELIAGQTVAVTASLSAQEVGTGLVTLRLSGENDLALEQQIEVPVRPASLPVTVRQEISLAPGASLTVDGELLSGSLLQDASVSLNVTRVGGLDLPALLMSLDRYPYGCAEQTTSRALPLVYFNELSKIAGLPPKEEIDKRVQDAILRVLSYQSSSGSFGLWGPGYGDMWLDAYVSDFLTRAREQGYDVPAPAMVQALTNLQNQVGYGPDIRERGNELAYALYVLARNRKAALSDLRYYADTALDNFPTPLAKAHLAAALSLYGDTERSRSIFLDTLQMSEQALVTPVSLNRSDYGSSLRDGAAVLALAAESRPVPPIVPDLARLVAQEWRKKRNSSTQEQAWALLAARALQEGDDGLKLAVDGAAHRGSYMARIEGGTLIDQPVELTNQGSDAVSVAVTTVAAPSEPLPAGGEGFSISRGYYTLDGVEANISEAQQNERYVVVLEVTESDDWPQDLLISDLLPAGFEIDNPSLVDSAKLANFEWVGQTETSHLEFRNDRFVAAIDRAAGVNDMIRLAYVVRAVRPGVYDHPAAFVEDMYRPQFNARTATGRMSVRTED